MSDVSAEDLVGIVDDAKSGVEQSKQRRQAFSGLKSVWIKDGTLTFRPYLDPFIYPTPPKRRIIRNMTVHTINGKNYLCLGEGCSWCEAAKEAKKLGFKRSFIFANKDMCMFYGCVYSATWADDNLILNTPLLILGGNYRIRDAINVQFVKFAENTAKLLKFLNPKEPFNPFELDYAHGKQGKANLSYDIISERVMPDLPADTPPLADAYIPEDTVYSEKEVADGVMFIMQTARAGINVRDPQPTQFVVPDLNGTGTVIVGGTIPVETPPNAPKCFGSHTGSPQCILCDRVIEQVCVRKTQG
jgi:hypothetical protein